MGRQNTHRFGRAQTRAPAAPVAFVVGLGWASACQPEPELPPPPPPVDERPDILLVTVDTLRADRVGAYGDTLARTPAFDTLAARGVLFREAHSVTPLTLPSHTSILTGLYPKNHGLRDNGGFRLEARVPTLAEALQESGYQTAAFVGAFVLDGAWGLDRGFETYRDPFHPQDVARVGAFGEVELPSAEVVNAAVAWWRSAKKQTGPRFAWVHIYDPHTPWAEHAGWTGDPYRGEVAHADTVLARLFDTVGEDTLIVLTSDHGEGLWEGGEREHGVLLGPGVTRVPLIIRPPGGLSGTAEVQDRSGLQQHARPDGIDPSLVLDPVPDAPKAARVVDAPVSGVDVAPTIAAWAEVSLKADGHSLRAVVEGNETDHPPVYAETFFPLLHFGWSPLTMARDSEVRREQGARSTVVRVADGSPAENADALADVVAKWRGESLPEPAAIDPETAAALEALGYLTTAAPLPENPPDPRDRIDVLTALHAAETLSAPDRLPRLRALVAEEPDMVDAAIALSLAEAETGDVAAARQTTRSVLLKWPDHPTALFNAAALALDAGDGTEALLLARRLLALNDQDARGWRIVVAVYALQGEVDSMRDAAEKGLAVAPDDPNLHYLLALAETQGGDPKVGIEHLEAARKHGSEASDLDLWLGVANERAGNVDAALEHYRTATRTMAHDARPWAMAGWMLYKADRCAEAWPFLVNLVKRGAGGDPKVAEAAARCRPADNKKH
jgi:arylsulfatase A-like enzyme/tetratricopeptide (TPR) repeat protein